MGVMWLAELLVGGVSPDRGLVESSKAVFESHDREHDHCAVQSRVLHILPQLECSGHGVAIKLNILRTALVTSYRIRCFCDMLFRPVHPHSDIRNGSA